MKNTSNIDVQNVQPIIAFMAKDQVDKAVSEFNHHDADQKYRVLRELFEYCNINKDLLPQTLKLSGYIVPQLGSGRRFACLVRIFEILHDSEQLFGKDIYNLLDFSIVRALMPLEVISLANILAGYVNSSPHRLKEVSIWGLVRLIPHMHSVNQKEYANEIFQMHTEPQIRSQVLESLTTLIYSMDQSDRANLIHFFADVFKKNESAGDKYFTVDLLEKVTPALPEHDRTYVAEHVVPLIYFSDTRLVKKAIEFFSMIINLLPSSDRFYYAQTITSLINDLSVKSDVIHAIEKSLPFLIRPEERNQLADILKQFGRTSYSSDVDDDQESFLQEAQLYNS